MSVRFMKTLCLCGVFEKSVVIVEVLLVAEERD